MKALKGLLIYIGIVLGIVVGIGLILFCIMYFVPSFRIFGVGVVHYNKTVDTETIALTQYSNYDDIVININSNKININVVPTEEKDISYDLDLQIFGFSNEIIEYQVIQKAEVKDRVLQIYLNLTEPRGWISTSNSNVTVSVPYSLPIGLVTNTTSGAVAVGSTSLGLDIKSLSISTEKGDVNLVGIGENGSESETSLTLESLNLTTKKGEFDFSNITNLIVKDKVKLIAENGEFNFKNLYASVEVTGDGIEFKADKIECGADGFSFIVKDGQIDIDILTLEYIDVTSTYISAEHTIIAENISIDINEIIGKTAIVTSHGDVEIEKLNNYTLIENDNGNVNIAYAKDNIIIKTYFGDINVDEYFACAEFSSHKGNINVNSKGDYVSNVYTKITNIDGNVIIGNKVNQLLLETTGKSNVKITFYEVHSGDRFQHLIKTSREHGSCDVYLPTVNVPCFKFKATGIISGDYSASNTFQYSPSDASIEEKQDADKNAFFEFDGRIKLIKHLL